MILILMLLQHRVLIATIRDMGGCPCPRCTITKDMIPGLGTQKDSQIRARQARHDNDERWDGIEKARKFIYDKHYVVTSKPVEEILKPNSQVPTEV